MTTEALARLIAVCCIALMGVLTVLYVANIATKAQQNANVILAPSR